ncbi:MAG: hypothetical protein CFH10_00020 [Alphaproteobacteria bacterium MarineAlpha4_Bin2]|nr:MAG: hypothetical protein CFH10_00020 [Alphaproteobacteria bacterium MarineAlpha4_Bin2]
MIMKDIAVFRMTTGKMEWLAERQRVLSQNIANADTPGYSPRDLKALDFKKLVERVDPMKLKGTHSNHVNLGTEVRKFKFDTSKASYEVAPDGNAVILEEQMVKVAQTSNDYDLMASLYRKHANMIKIALGRGQGH